MNAFIGIDHEDKIQVMVGDGWHKFPLSQEGCREAARYLIANRITDWGYSSTIDAKHEYAHLFDRNVGDAIEEEVNKIIHGA